MRNFIKNLFPKKPLGIYDASLQTPDVSNYDPSFIVQGYVTAIEREDESDPTSKIKTISVVDTLLDDDQLEYPSMPVKNQPTLDFIDIGDDVRIKGDIVDDDAIFHVVELENRYTHHLTYLITTDNNFRQEELDSLPENAFIFDGTVQKIYHTNDIFKDLVQLQMYDIHSKQEYIIDTPFPAPEGIKVGDVIRAQGERQKKLRGTSYRGSVFFRWPE